MNQVPFIRGQHFAMDLAAGMNAGLAHPAAAAGRLLAAVEVVLLDHADELDGDEVDPNMAELAHCYEQVTGRRPGDG